MIFRDVTDSGKDNSDNEDTDICRVCRLSGDEPLYYPCKCIGTIKYVHQKCLTEWLKHSKKEACELCNHKFSFKPIYKADMPSSLPLTVMFKGMNKFIQKALKTAFTYIIVSICWTIVVPFMSFRLYSLFFNLDYHYLLPKITDDEFVKAIARDVSLGWIVMLIMLGGFFSFLWIKEQIMQSAPHDFINLPERQHDVVEIDPLHLINDVLDNNTNRNESQDGNINDNNERYDLDMLLENDTNFNNRGNLTDNNIDRGLRNGDLNEVPHLNVGDSVEDLANEDINNHIEEVQWDNEDDNLVNDDMFDENNVNINDGENLFNDEENIPNQINDADRIRGFRGDNIEEENNEDWGDRGDEFTWRRFLGFDGSFLFLGHIAWVLGITAIITVLFATLPYKVGMSFFPMDWIPDHLKAFEAIAGISAGYVIGMIGMYVVHSISGFLRYDRIYKISGIAYLLVKVVMLIIIEIVVFPLLSGILLDMSSLAANGATLSDKASLLQDMPWAFVITRWTFGMNFIFYSASIIMNLRDLLRPEVLWFIRNLNDPDFNPIHEMIEQPLVKHARRTMLSIFIFSMLVLLVTFFPLTIISKVLPSILPFRIYLYKDVELVTDYVYELFILNYVLPNILNHFNARAFTKSIAKVICLTIGKYLGLLDYLLAPEDRTLFNDDNEDRIHFPPELGIEGPIEELHLGMQHHALQLNQRERGNQSNKKVVRPNYFKLRIIALILCGCITVITIALGFYVLPTVVGRFIFGAALGFENVHEFYTFGIGIFALWPLFRGSVVAYEWAMMGWSHILKTMKSFAKITLNIIFAAIPIIVIFPILFGYYIYSVIVVPYRLYFYHQTIVFHVGQYYANGFVLCKAICSFITIGPEWWFKNALENLYLRGFRHIRLKEFYVDIVLPLAAFILFQVSFPVVLAEVAFLFTGSSVYERIYLSFLMPLIFLSLQLVVCFIYWQYNKWRKLSQKIRNEQYLIGKELVNYDNLK
uniref:RING-type E3 ubiquitin transferase n=1 Tax=Strongyloides stercoralis TaxID=6248 RepID=A0A0K0E802_STRER